MIYEPSDWFWIVAGDESRLWSSKAGGYVDAAEVAFTNWTALGNLPTRIKSEAELTEVLLPYGVATPNPVTKRERIARMLQRDGVTLADLKAELARPNGP